MNVSRANKLWPLGVFVAFSAAACDQVDHPVGATDSGTGGNVSGASVSVSNTGGSVFDTGDSASGTTTATTGKVSGAGGSDSVSGTTTATSGNGSGTGGSANDADGGESSAEGGESGGGVDLTLPDDCTWVLGSYDGYQCEIEVECAGTPVSSFCSTVDDYFECECLHTNPVQGFHMTETTLDDACRLTLAACLSYPELEAGPYECLPSVYDVDEPDHCVSDVFCTREGVIGDANFTEEQERVAECFAGPSGWACECASPGLLFELPTATSSPPCLDARDWCAGLDVEQIGSRSCHVTDRGEGEDICSAAVECERAVTLSGQEATMYEMDRIECTLASEGLYQCRCSGEGPYTEIAAEDLASACDNGVSVCESD